MRARILGRFAGLAGVQSLVDLHRPGIAALPRRSVCYPDPGRAITMGGRTFGISGGV